MNSRIPPLLSITRVTRHDILHAEARLTVHNEKEEGVAFVTADKARLHIGCPMSNMLPRDCVRRPCVRQSASQPSAKKPLLLVPQDNDRLYTLEHRCCRPCYQPALRSRTAVMKDGPEPVVTNYCTVQVHILRQESPKLSQSQTVQPSQEAASFPQDRYINCS